MAYEVPPVWAHGDVPTAALMATYSNSLNAIKAILDETPKNPVAPVYMGEDEDDGDWQIVHINRYLIYDDEATIQSLVDSANTASLPKPEAGTKGVYDLDTISWLVYGQPYRVTGCAWIIEDWEP